MKISEIGWNYLTRQDRPSPLDRQPHDELAAQAGHALVHGVTASVKPRSTKERIML